MDLSFLSGVFASPWNIIRSLIDITIISYLFYRVLRLIRGTRAEQLLRGLVLLLVFSILASYLNLALVSWLLNKLWIAFAIALPIVFQPELRRILEQIGRGSFFTVYRSTAELEEYRSIIKEVSSAAAVLSRNRVGALIIMTRETGIAEYLESGVELNALVSAGLLINIFVPNSPLHDGAVAISSGRIDKASCFLPLSDNPFLDSELGTRHRAALGITEISDAVAVVVSEETGTISLVKDGSLQRHLDEKSLQDALKREFAERPRWGDSLRRRWLGDDEKGREKIGRA